jgi:hypothetical protein
VSSLLARSLAIAAVSTATNWRIHAKTVRPQKRTLSKLRTWGLAVCCLSQASSLGGGCRGMGAAQRGLVRAASSNAPNLFNASRWNVAVRSRVQRAWGPVPAGSCV